MPAPKAYIPFFVTLSHNREFTIKFDSLIQQRKGHLPPLSSDELKKSFRLVMDSVAFYLACREQASTPTVTRQQQTLLELAQIAKKALASLDNASECHRFCLAIESWLRTTDLSTKYLAKRILNTAEGDIMQALADARLHENFKPISQASQKLLDNISKVATLAKLNPIQGLRWCHPHLAELVLGLIPVWTKITGRTFRRYAGMAHHPFADWIIEVLEQVEAYPLPSTSMVKQIVLGLDQATKKSRF